MNEVRGSDGHRRGPHTRDFPNPGNRHGDQYATVAINLTLRLDRSSRNRDGDSDILLPPVFKTPLACVGHDLEEYSER
jgi:hypothetical protein